jgi:hypothetical protein
MATKDYFRQLVETVVFRTKKTQEQLAIEMGYGKTYISEVLSPTGKLSEKFIEAFKRRYNEYLTGAIVYMPGKPPQELTDFQSDHEKSEHAKYVKLLEDQIAFLKQSVQTNLTEISGNIIAGRAEFRAVAIDYQLMKDSKGDEKKREVLMEQINKLIHLQLTGGQTKGNSSVSDR